MPFFPEQQLLFVHIPKNAGRSVEEVLLGRNGSPDDGRRNLVSRASTKLQRSSASAFAVRYLIGTLDVTLASQHLTYVEMEMLGLLPDTIALSFAIVRNPYDRALSSVMHFDDSEWAGSADENVRKNGFGMALRHWLDRPLRDHNERAHRRAQIDYLRDKTGAIAVDRILRFENVEEDFAALMREVGQPSLSLPKRGHSGRKRTYRDYYSPEIKQMVEEAFGEDIAHFGYDY